MICSCHVCVGLITFRFILQKHKALSLLFNSSKATNIAYGNIIEGTSVKPDKSSICRTRNIIPDYIIDIQTN